MSRVIVADKWGITDGAAYKFLQRIETDVPLVLISRVEGYVFNDELNSLRGKKWVAINFIENGWQWAQTESVKWGQNRNKFDFLSGDEWAKLEDFIVSNPPALSFVRELLKKDVSDVVKPIEYANWQAPYPVQSKEQYFQREIDLFFFWGRSNEIRVQTHGDIWKGATQYGYSVCDNIFYFDDFINEEKGRKVVSLNIPHYKRIEIRHILDRQQKSKFSLSLFGAGVKCFRSTGEAPCNSLMICQEDNLAWTFPFENTINCFQVPTTPFINIPFVVEGLLHRTDLYDIYKNGVELADKYRLPNYTNHLELLINNA